MSLAMNIVAALRSSMDWIIVKFIPVEDNSPSYVIGEIYGPFDEHEAKLTAERLNAAIVCDDCSWDAQKMVPKDQLPK